MRALVQNALRGGLLCAMLACSSSSAPTSATRASLTTNTDSRSIPQPTARLAFFARYIKAKSPLADAEFIVRFQDNSAGDVPGPSDWDIKALLLTQGDVAAWHTGWLPCAADSAAEPPWVSDLLRRRPEWRTSGEPACYRDPRRAASRVFVFAASALVALQDASEP